MARNEVTKKEMKDAKMWHDRISLAKKAKEDWKSESGADRFVKMYKGVYDIYFHGLRGKIPVPPINEVFAYVQSDIAATYNRDPYFSVNPKAGTVAGAKLREIRLNYWWRELKVKEELEMEIVDKDLVGSGWHKVGYAGQAIGTDEQLKIENESLFSLRVDWKDMFWNVGAKRPPFDCQWMAQRIVRPLEDIKKQYPRAKGVQGSIDPDVKKDYYKDDGRMVRDDIKVGVGYEIWDPKKREILLILEGLEDRYLTDPIPWPEHMDEFPFHHYWDFWNPNSAYPLSAIAPWEPQILEEMILLAQAINHSKRWNRQVFYNGGAIDDVAADKFERGDDGAFIRVPGKVGADDLRFVDYGTLPVDFYLLMDRLQSIKRNIHGQPEFSRGGVTKTSTRTVGELEMMQMGAKGREDRKIDRLETHLENIARHMDMHLQANFDFEETVKVTGGTPEEVLAMVQDFYDPITQTVTYTPEDIKGEYDIEIKSGSTLPLNRINKQRILETALLPVAQVAARGAVSPLFNAIINEILDGYDIKSIKEAYQQELQLLEQQRQAEAEKGDVEERKTAAEAAKREAQAQDVSVETAIKAQDAEMGSIGRAELERLKKAPMLSENGEE